MKHLFPLLLLVTLVGCLLPGGGRSLSRKRLQEMSVPSQVESIEITVFERDNVGRHQILKKFETREPDDIEILCSILRDKKIRTYYATEPSNDATLFVKNKGQDDTFCLHLSGKHFFISGGFMEISDAEHKRLWEILNKER